MPELRRGAALATEVAAFSVLGVSLAWLMWAVIEPVGPLSSGASAAPAPNNVDLLQARLAQLPEISMHGGGASVTTQSASSYVLHATRAGPYGDGTAILSSGGAAQASFAVGDEITAGARLVLVAADHVEIETGGQRLRIAFSGAELAGTVLRAPIAENRPVPTGQLINAAPLHAVHRPGGRSAIAVTPQADLAQLGASGLQPGDILLKVDGVDVSSANLASYAAQLQSGRSFEVVYERNGQIGATRIGKPAP